ncbi:MAG: filamentous hemagglutinin, partial [Fischerella sp. CENA71]|nr:filamentous hemagglutinin [Fischerella sp. CENA71]
MLKKSFAFGLLAAGLMIAPGAAFADVQSNQQNATQNGAAA